MAGGTGVTLSSACHWLGSALASVYVASLAQGLAAPATPLGGEWGAWVCGASAWVLVANHVVQRKNLSLQRKKHLFQRKNLSFQRENHLVQRKNLSFQSKNLPFQRKNLSFQSLEQRSARAKVARGWRLWANKRGGRVVRGVSGMARVVRL